jgi:RNA polymerase sigma-70 factor (ECF subfamily)
MDSSVTSRRETRLDYATLFASEWHGVVRYFVRAIRDADLAQDLAQETFLRAAQGFARFRGNCSPRTWLRRIAANVLRDHWRRRVSQGWAGFRPWSPEEDVLFADGRESPALAIERRQVQACLGNLVGQLPSGEREALVLAVQGALPAREIARRLGLTPEAARTRLHRARRKLAAMVGRRCALVTDEGGALSCEARSLHPTRLDSPLHTLPPG